MAGVHGATEDLEEYGADHVEGSLDAIETLFCRRREASAIYGSAYWSDQESTGSTYSGSHSRPFLSHNLVQQLENQPLQPCVRAIQTLSLRAPDPAMHKFISFD